MSDAEFELLIQTIERKQLLYLIFTCFVWVVLGFLYGLYFRWAQRERRKMK